MRAMTLILLACCASRTPAPILATPQDIQGYDTEAPPPPPQGYDTKGVTTSSDFDHDKDPIRAVLRCRKLVSLTARRECSAELRAWKGQN